MSTKFLLPIFFMTFLTLCTKASPIKDNLERNFILIKPNAVERGLVGEIIRRLELKGFKLVAMKFTKVGVS